MPYFERAALAVSVTATGLALVALTASHWWWLLAISLTIAASLGAIWTRGQATDPAALAEASPVALLALGSSVFLRQVEGPWRWGALALAVFLLIALFLGGYYRLDPRSHLFGAARFTSNLVVYFLALGYFAGIYGTRARSLQSATAITLVAFLLALAVYSLVPPLTRRSWLAAAVSGLMMGEVTWGLNYWPLGGLVGGLFLLLVFYGLTGTLHSYLQGHLDRGIVLEFVAVLLGGFALLAASSLWMG